MGIVQVKIKIESPIGSSTSLTGGKKEKSIQTRMVNTKHRNTCFSSMKTKLILEVSLWKKSFAYKAIYSIENVKCFPNFQIRIDFQFQNPKPKYPNYFQ